jgi:NAD+ kinase
MMEVADLIIAVGGDGSMLTAARVAASAGIPLVGINRGRLGFLADVSPSDKLESLDHILAGEYDSEKRMLLRADIISDDGTKDCGAALNDIVIKRHQIGRMLDFRTNVDGRYVNTHGGDGFIVATPTGSTAYALSCGGPIVTPNLDAVVLTPICPHTLSDRPLVIPATSVTEIELTEGHADNAEVSCDGEVTGYLSTGQTLRVEAAKDRVELIHPSGYDYYEILRNKLYWGRGNRKSLANT